MTVSQIEPVKNHYGNNSATTFDFDFYIETENQLLVQHTDMNGLQTTLTLGVDYSINEIGNEEGSYITFPLQGSEYGVLAWNQSTDEKELLTISLNIPFSQDFEFDISGELDKSQLERAFDYGMRIDQILKRRIERAVLVPEGSATTPQQLIDNLNEAQINAQNFAQIAAEKATAANNSAIAAGEEATIATQQAAIVQETYDDAMTDIAADKLDALNAISSAKTNAENAIATDKADFETLAQNKSNSLQNQFNGYSSTLDGQIDAVIKNFDRMYEGVNLETKFATEIAAAGNVYAWLSNRKNAGNFEGIHVGDYFSVNLGAGTVAGYSIAAQTFKCRIVGINTYKSCGDTPIGNMFYCISDEVINTPIKWNPTNNNNGTAVQNNPWLASAAYAVLNGVNNYTTNAYSNAAHGANASAKGILQLLPSALQNVLKQKRNILDSRYSASGLLTGGTNWEWGDMGKLWLPNEYEVYGCAVRSNLSQTEGFWHPEAGLSIQFPWFANNCEHRIKKNSSGSRCGWWLSSAASYDTTGVCYVDGGGLANSRSATSAAICLPLCFCI